MLATIAIEVGLLIYTIFRYRLNPVTRLVLPLLFLLALFQLAEYSVCGRFNVNAETWSRIGYVAITLLPPLGIHLIQLIARRGWFWIKWVAYASSLIWVVTFGLSEAAFNSYQCGGNYVIFQLANGAGKAYFGYYYFWLFVSIMLSIIWAVKATKRIRLALLLYAASYLAFLLPTTIINNLYPATRSGIPSIMCGFAVLFALILVLVILPLRLDKHKP